MTETTDDQAPLFFDKRRRPSCLIVVAAILLSLLLLFIIALLLALTLFKPKQPSTQLISATLDGVSPRISFPLVSIEINITLDLQLLVTNPNHASFKHGPGASLLYYRGNQVGEAHLSPGFIPSGGSETLPCRLTIEADQIASNMTALINDALAGQLAMETHTRIPGRVNFLGIFKKHAVATSQCRFIVAIRAMKIESQQCKSKTKF